MKKIILLQFLCFTAFIHLSAQGLNQQRYFIGGYYTFIIDQVVPEGGFDTFSYSHQYLNVNFRYALNRAWRVGVEYILTITAADEVDDPFSTFGLTMDYDILRAKRSKLHLRAGLSFSNLSFAGDGFPQKRFVVNRVLGGSYEYRISNVFWVYGGFYHHLPLNAIEDKYAMVQPFIGICVGI
jgi:hypothetical protein